MEEMSFLAELPAALAGRFSTLREGSSPPLVIVYLSSLKVQPGAQALTDTFCLVRFGFGLSRFWVLGGVDFSRLTPAGAAAAVGGTVMLLLFVDIDVDAAVVLSLLVLPVRRAFSPPPSLLRRSLFMHMVIFLA